MSCPTEYLRLNPAIKLIQADKGLYLVKDSRSGKFWKVDEGLFKGMKKLKLMQEIGLAEDCALQSTFSDAIMEALVSRKWVVSSLENGSGTQPKAAPDYLLFSFVILPEGLVNWLASRLVFLYHPSMVMLTSILILLWIFHYQLVLAQEVTMDRSETLPFVFMMFLSVLFHELGHATALVKFGQTSGNIGGAFYLLSPVMFTDVTNSWALKKWERLVVNSGGMYFEAILCATGYGFFLLFGPPERSALSLFILFKTLWNLNPFLRSDGYWILSDLLNIPNLRQRSARVWKSLFLDGFNWKQLPLLLYSGFSALVVFYFLYYTLILHSDIVLELPDRVYPFLQNEKAYPLTMLNWKEHIPVAASLILYVLILKGIIKFVWEQLHRFAKKLHCR